MRILRPERETVAVGYASLIARFAEFTKRADGITIALRSPGIPVTFAINSASLTGARKGC
jgi:hypothetical protein